MKKRFTIRTLAAVLCLALCMTSLTGCKYSAKLHELIQNRYEHLLTIDSSKEFVNTLDSDTLTEELVSILETEEAERETEENPETPQAGDEAQSAEPARNQKVGETAQRRTRLTGKSSKSRQNGETENQNDQPSANPSADSDSSGQGAGNGGSGDSGYDSVPGPPDVPTRQIVDGRGVYVEIPEDVSSTAAAGDTAAVLAMVGGEKTIKASSESFAWNAYQDSEIGRDIAVLWPGDGSMLMTEENFNVLLSIAPEVVVESSGTSSFTDEQLTRLSEAHIAYVVLPAMDSIDDMKLAVDVAGQLIGNQAAEGVGDSNDLASAYRNYADELLEAVSGRVSSAGTAAGFSDLNESGDGRYNGKYSLFIKGWDPDARWTITGMGTEWKSGIGAAYTGNVLEKSTVFMSQLMSVAGLENTMERKNDELASYIEYLSPGKGTRERLSASGAMASRMNNNQLLEINGSRLGEGKFPAVMITGSAARTALLNDELWQVYGIAYSADGAMHTNGFTLSNGSMVSSSIYGPYEVYVLPKGLGTWYNSPEAVLNTCWMAWKYYNAYTEEEVMEEVKKYYSVFYRIILSDDQARNMVNDQ